MKRSTWDIPYYGKEHLVKTETGKYKLPLRNFRFNVIIERTCKGLEWHKTTIEKMKNKKIPATTGVYYFKVKDCINKTSDIVYVGCSSNLNDRVKSSHPVLNLLRRDLCERYHIEIFYTELNRYHVHVETALICNIRPMFNIMSKDRVCEQRYVFSKID